MQDPGQHHVIAPNPHIVLKILEAGRNRDPSMNPILFLALRATVIDLLQVV